MRIWHRYLGFFLAGIMAMYAISGIVLIFRNTDFLKSDYEYTKMLEPNLTEETLGPALEFSRIEITSNDGEFIQFSNGTYDITTGEAIYVINRLPIVLDRMTKIHKANSNSPLFFLNMFFGASLLFFVISSFWMFLPSSKIFRKSLYFTAGGIVFTIVLLMF